MEVHGVVFFLNKSVNSLPKPLLTLRVVLEKKTRLWRKFQVCCSPSESLIQLDMDIRLQLVPATQPDPRPVLRFQKVH